MAESLFATLESDLINRPKFPVWPEVRMASLGQVEG